MEWKSHPAIQFCRQMASYTQLQLTNFIRALGSCDLCGQSCQSDMLVCDVCLGDLPKLDMVFYKGDLLNNPAIYRSIGKVHFDQLVCVSRYIWPYDQWISQLKYRRRFELAKVLGRLMAQQMQVAFKYNQLSFAPGELVVMPVPLHWFKQSHRSFNQASLLAKHVASFTGLDLNLNLIKRKQYTASQVGQSGAERRKNLKGAFTLAGNSQDLPKHVVLVDDVVTTGSTVNEISRLLKKHGVETVAVLSLALAN